MAGDNCHHFYSSSLYLFYSSSLYLLYSSSYLSHHTFHIIPFKSYQSSSCLINIVYHTYHRYLNARLVWIYQLHFIMMKYSFEQIEGEHKFVLSWMHHDESWCSCSTHKNNRIINLVDKGRLFAKCKMQNGKIDKL